MKKKASLWISGITTVAMLAVAVGSFAAWQTLNADTGNDFTATSNDPIVLTVETTKTGFENKQLVPMGAKAAMSEDSNDTVVETLIAEFTPKLKTTATATIKLGDTELKVADSLNASDFNTTVYTKSDYETNKTDLSKATPINKDGALTADTAYVAVVKFAKNDTEFNTDGQGTDVAALAGKKLDLKVSCVAEKTN